MSVYRITLIVLNYVARSILAFKGKYSYHNPKVQAQWTVITAI